VVARQRGGTGEPLLPLAAAAPIALFVASAEGSFAAVNDRWCALAGLAPRQALGLGWKAAVHPDDLDRVVRWLAADPAAHDESACQYRLVHPTAGVRRVECRTTPFRDERGGPPRWLGACVELTRRRRADDGAPGDGEQFALAFEHAPIATGLVDPDGAWLHVNSAFCELVGYPEAELLALDLADLLVSGDSPPLDERNASRAERRLRRADGNALWVSLAARPVAGADGEPLFTIVQADDIGGHKQTERELRRLADHDALTGLLNRRGFMDGLHRELRRMDRRGEYGALLVLDLDDFKLVNDTAGHLAGDQVLQTTAEVLRRRLRATDVIGRLGGDEFAALVLNVTPSQAREIAREMTDALQALSLTAGDHALTVAASIGVVAVDGVRAASEDELLAAADRAMYRAKGGRPDP
jgi:diguanylate cyclase (GGDEF)-like protein/PAS domain S-box-containing protein